MDDSGDTSIDPIVQDSPAHSPLKRIPTLMPSPRKPGRKARDSATPARSIILDTPNARNGSPWRIKVTVQAEPREGSPEIPFMRTTTIPLKSPSARRSGSPARKTPARLQDAADIKRPARKRKGTPIKDKRPARPYPQQDPTTEEDDVVPPRTRASSRYTTGKPERKSLHSESTRSKRLSVAREELDKALQDAVGRSGSARSDAPGDKTVSMNEDFSMISVDSLQTAKEASMSNVMQTIPEIDQERQKDEDSALSEIAVASSQRRLSELLSMQDEDPKLGNNSPQAHDHTPSRSHFVSHSAEIQYPDLEDEVAKAAAHIRHDYDPMSWKPTGIARVSSISAPGEKIELPSSWEDQWQSERKAVNRETKDANPRNVVVVEDDVDEESSESSTEEEDATAGENEAEERQDSGLGNDGDIWQDEASRSIQEEGAEAHNQSHQHTREAERSPQLEDLFAGQPLKPLRSKIPRTWRRSSGMDFSYIDSPAHEPAVEHKEERRHSTDGSGVLTPPSTDGEGDVDVDAQEVERAEVSEDDLESDFEPDAEATDFQYHGDDGEREECPPESDDELSDNSASPDRDDTGEFFFNNLPQVFKNPPRPRRRPPRQPTLDLTDLLNLDDPNSPNKAALTGSQASEAGSPKARSSSSRRFSPLHMRPVEGKIKFSPSEKSRDKAISSPLRRSLLRSSKVRGSPQAEIEKRDLQASSSQGLSAPPVRPRRSQVAREVRDERQFSRESAVTVNTHIQHRSTHDAETADEPGDEAVEYDDDELIDETRDDGEIHENPGQYQEDPPVEEMEVSAPFGSYEEHLNKDSPQKVRVNFDDSRTYSSVLDPANRKDYPSLFDNPNASQRKSSDRRQDSPGTITLISNEKPAPAQTGILSRLSTTFWSAVTGQATCTEEQRHQVQSQELTKTRQQHQQQQQEPKKVFPLHLVVDLRNRYGVISESFPWTWHHTRVLHRMLNSLVSRRSDSIIPRSGPLPSTLLNLCHKQQTSLTHNYRWTFTRPQAYVVWSFFQVMVEDHVLEAMRKGEVEWLGDSRAKFLREYARTDQHGTELFFVPERYGEDLSSRVNGRRGEIEVEFVVQMLGLLLQSNAELEKRKGMPFEEWHAIHMLE